jgi:hypothetical protein
MLTAQSTVGFSYYVIVAVIGIELAGNFFRSKETKTKILYSIVLIPFILRLLRVK